MNIVYLFSYQKGEKTSFWSEIAKVSSKYLFLETWRYPIRLPTWAQKGEKTSFWSEMATIFRANIYF